MIVVAAYDSLDYVRDFLDSISNSNIDESVLIVCTCPKQISFIQSLEAFLLEANYPFKLSHTVTPYSGYDSGAYIWAYNMHIDDYYVFLHDSVVANHPMWLERFKAFRREDILNTWCYFDIVDESPHTDFFLPKIGGHPSLNGYPGVFGPMFQISRKALIQIDSKYTLNNFIPTNKTEACAMERGWTYLAVASGLGINNIDGHYSRNVHDYQNKSLTKYLRNRH